ncbi:Ig-like domain-containing protein [Chlamydiota bacterium]
MSKIRGQKKINSFVCLLIINIIFLGCIPCLLARTKDYPPVVVKTIPQGGQENALPGSTEIKVIFSKEMTLDSWSFVRASQETFPEIIGHPRFLSDMRTCVLPVVLGSNKTYVLWINTEKFNNFKDASGIPAVPYLLVFETIE